jgi:hypothetical protein
MATEGDKMLTAARIEGTAIRAMIDMEAMRVGNWEASLHGKAPVFKHKAFFDLATSLEKCMGNLVRSE